MRSAMIPDEIEVVAEGRVVEGDVNDVEEVQNGPRVADLLSSGDRRDQPNECAMADGVEADEGPQVRQEVDRAERQQVVHCHTRQHAEEPLQMTEACLDGRLPTHGAEFRSPYPCPDGSASVLR